MVATLQPKMMATLLRMLTALLLPTAATASADFASRAAAEPRLLPQLLPRPNGGVHEWTFALYGAPPPLDGNPEGSAFANLTRGMKKFGVGNGFDPFGTSVTAFTEGSKLGWPISFSPIEGGNVCFQVPGCVNNMTVEQHARLKILDDANVYSEIQFAEWGYFFTGLQPAKGGGNIAWWHAVFANTTCNATLCQSAPKNPSNKCCAACLASKSCGALTNTTLFDVKYAAYATPVKDSEGRSLFGYKTMPQSRKEAYEAYRDYYNSRIAWISSVGDQPYAPMARINSVTCVSNMEAYAALWNSQGPNAGSTINAGLELQCSHANIAFAMARGGSRRFGKVWTVQPSGWGYGPTTEGCGPLHCAPKGANGSVARDCTAAEMAAGATCSGAEASHSYSWYWRVWHHAWFAGAAKVTEEGPAMGLFECDSDGALLTTFDAITHHGRNAQSVLGLARAQDRGTPLTPLGVVVDLYLGYNAGVGPVTNSWNVLPMSGNDTALDFLFKSQLFVASGLPDAELKTTPHGEIADVILSDADSDFLALYPVLLLVGEHDFSDEVGLPARLLAALQSPDSAAHELVLQQYHVDTMPPAAWAKLKATGKARVVSPSAVGSQVPAISNEDLAAIGAKHLPVVVENATRKSDGMNVSILWQVNAQKGGGFVIELSNEYGVNKAPCASMTLDPGGEVTVTLRLNKAAGNATEWISGAMLASGELAKGATLEVAVAAGNTSFVAFGGPAAGTVYE